MLEMSWKQQNHIGLNSCNLLHFPADSVCGQLWISNTSLRPCSLWKTIKDIVFCSAAKCCKTHQDKVHECSAGPGQSLSCTHLYEFDIRELLRICQLFQSFLNTTKCVHNTTVCQRERTYKLMWLQLINNVAILQTTYLVKKTHTHAHTLYGGGKGHGGWNAGTYASAYASVCDS